MTDDCRHITMQRIITSECIYIALLFVLAGGVNAADSSRLNTSMDACPWHLPIFPES